MRAVVTGGAGFIGSHLVRKLIGEGYDTVIIDNFSSGSTENLPEKGFGLIRGDIRDYGACAEACKGADLVFHLAALKSVPESLSNPREYNAVNIDGTLNMLEAARIFGVKRFIFASSSAVYGNSESPFQKESDPPMPLSPYALTKLAGEYYLKIYAENYQMQTVSLRYFNIFGPGQTLDDEYSVVIPKFIDCISRGEAVPVFGNGRQSRDFTYIENVIDANLLASAAENVSGEVFNVATGSSYSILDLLGILKAVLGGGSVPEFLPRRPGDVFRSVADIDKAREKLGYIPKAGFEKGLDETAAWFAGNTSVKTPEEVI